MHRLRSGLALCTLALGITGCDANDLVSLRLSLNDDFSGTVVASSLATPPDPGVFEQATRGVTWRDRLAVIGTSGTFDDISKLAVDDVSFASGKTPDGMSYVAVTLPCGPETRWARTLVPQSSEDRTRLAPLFDPTGEVKILAAKIKFQIDLPATPTAHGVSPSLNGVKEEVDANRATLLVSVDAAVATVRSMTWQVTWRK